MSLFLSCFFNFSDKKKEPINCHVQAILENIARPRPRPRVLTRVVKAKRLFRGKRLKG